MISEILEILGLVSSLPKNKSANKMIDLTDRKLFSDINLIKTFVSSLKLVGENNKNWTKEYFDLTTNQGWLSYYVNASQQGGGNNILALLPLPTTDGLVDIALNTKMNDEIVAACQTLTENEAVNNEEFRLILIDKLELISDKERQRKIVELVNLSSTLNRRYILGKSIEEITSDANYYKQIAERAVKLMNTAGNSATKQELVFRGLNV